MSRSSDSFLPSDIRLLLRADAEQHWLHREVIPVLRHLEAPERLPEEEVGAALAYLEAMWDEAMARALETDAVHGCLCARSEQGETLAGPAGRYHAAVRALRRVVAERVRPFVDGALAVRKPGDERFDDGLHRADTPGCDMRVTDARPDGCPRAA
jgi:hypothetical protein